jgi:hypothetical protein
MCIHENLPLMIGGDYNIFRYSEKTMTDIIIGGPSFLTLS